MAPVISMDLLFMVSALQTCLDFPGWHLNKCPDEPHLPLGGQKASGYGKFGGNACINEFTEDRVVTIGTHGHHYPF